MAASIIEITQNTGECSAQDLYGKGYTKEEIRSHWHMAQSLAMVELKLMEQEPLPKRRHGVIYA